MIFILDQNHAFLESSIFFICHVVLVLIFLHFLVGKGDFSPGICWFECGLFTHPCCLQRFKLCHGFEYKFEQESKNHTNLYPKGILQKHFTLNISPSFKVF